MEEELAAKHIKHAQAHLAAAARLLRGAKTPIYAQPLGITPKLEIETGLPRYQTFIDVYPKAEGSTAYLDPFKANNYNYNPTGPLAVNPANFPTTMGGAIYPAAFPQSMRYTYSNTVPPTLGDVGPQYNPALATKYAALAAQHTAIAAKYVNKVDFFNKPLPSARYFFALRPGKV